MDVSRDAPPVDASAAAHFALRRRGCVGVDGGRACAAGNRRTNHERAAKGRRVQIEAQRRRRAVYVYVGPILSPSLRLISSVICSCAFFLLSSGSFACLRFKCAKYEKVKAERIKLSTRFRHCCAQVHLLINTYFILKYCQYLSYLS